MREKKSFIDDDTKFINFFKCKIYSYLAESSQPEI